MKIKEFNLNEELEKEQERLEREIIECDCDNNIGFAQLELGKCNICDVRYAKHEGIRFAGEKFGEFIKRLNKEIDDIVQFAELDEWRWKQLIIMFKDKIDKLAGDKNE